MDRIFAIESGGVFVLVDGKWHRCTISPTAVEVHEKVKITPEQQYNLYEARTKTAGMVFEEPEPEPEPEPEKPAAKKGEKEG